MDPLATYGALAVMVFAALAAFLRWRGLFSYEGVGAALLILVVASDLGSLLLESAAKPAVVANLAHQRLWPTIVLLVGLAALALGLAATSRSPRSLASLLQSCDQAVLVRAGWSLFLLGTGMKFVGILSLGYWNPLHYVQNLSTIRVVQGPLGGFWDQGISIAVLGLGILSALSGRALRTWLFCIAALVLSFFLSYSSADLLGMAFVFVFLFVVFRHPFVSAWRRRPFLAVFTVLVITAAVIANAGTKTQFRSSGELVLDPATLVSTAMTKIGGRFSSEGLYDGYANLVNRLGQTAPFFDGRVATYMATGWIPYVVYPDKPIHPFRDVGQLINRDGHSQATETSAPTLVGSAYADAGLPSAILYLALFGVLLGLARHRIAPAGGLGAVWYLHFTLVDGASNVIHGGLLNVSDAVLLATGSTIFVWFVETARAAPKPQRAPRSIATPPGGWPTVSIVVPCRNEERRIGDALNAILANDYPPGRIEVLVMDGLSTDRTRETVAALAARDARVRLVDNPEQHIPAAMNTGIRAATGDIVMKMDAHSTYPPDYLRATVALLLETGGQMAGGAIDTLPGGPGRTARAIALALSHPWGSLGSSFRLAKAGVRESDAAAFGCWRRQDILQWGGFDLRLRRSSDIELNRRIRAAGGRIFLDPDIRAGYYATADLGTFARKNWDDGIWAVLPYRFVRRAASKRHLVALVALVGTILLAAVATVSPAARGLLLTGLAAYATLTLGTAAALATRARDVWLVAPLTSAFVVRHASYALGSLWGGFRVVLSAETWRARRSHILWAYPRLRALAHNQVARRRIVIRRPVQRFVDLTLALLALAILAIPLTVVALAIRRDDPGPVLYKGPRIGQGGKPFSMLKFRTMVVNADRIGPSSTSGRDPRITRVGRFLRATKLDELPQLFNVLVGQMSLVGPRPEVKRFVDQFTGEERQILSVRPGMTDWASLRFNDEGGIIERSGIADADEAYARIIRPAKLRYQLRYARRATVFTDLRILFATVATLISTRLGGRTIGVPALRPDDWGDTRPSAEALQLLTPHEHPRQA